MNHPFITVASALKNFLQQYRSALIVVCNLLLACFIISVVPCYCQDERYYIQHITSDNGLPQNSIKGLETDKNGFIWMATEMGFVRYDGKTLRVYSNTSKPAVNVKRIESLGLLPDSNIYAGINDTKYFYLSAGSIIKPFIPTGSVKLLLDTLSLNRPFIVQDSCIKKYKDHYIESWALPDAKNITKSVLNSIVYFNGSYYYFNRSKELIKANGKLSDFTKMKITGKLATELIDLSSKGKNISILKDNNRLYVSFNEWLYEMNFKNEITTESNPLIKTTGINNITCLRKIDKYGLLLVGTMADGLYIFHKKSFTVLQLDDPGSNIFYAQVPFGDNGVFTQKAVLFPGSCRYINSDISAESILKTYDGHYYIHLLDPLDSPGIGELDSSLRIIKYYTHSNLQIKCFRQLKNGSVWFSSVNNFMGYLDADSIHWVQRPKGLQKNFIVESFIEAGKDSFWLAGNDGLVIFDLKKNNTTYIPGLGHIEARWIEKDEKGTIWICTYGNGFYAWYKNRLVAIPMDRKNYLSNAHSLLNDKLGYCWIPTNDGLFRTKTTDLYAYLDGQATSVYYYYFDHTAGFLTNEFNGGCVPASITLNNGWLSFPSVNGLVQCMPDSVAMPLPYNNIYIDALEEDSTIIQTPADNISIPSNIRHISFYITSPYFGNSYNQYIEYKIPGDDGNWYPLNEDGIIHLNRPGHGNFKLMLRKTSGFDTKAEITKELSFYIEPAYTETILFKVLIALAVLAFIFMVFHIRLDILLKQKRKLQEDIKSHTVELNLLIESLESNMREVEQSREELHQSTLLRERLSMIIVHDLESPLRFLSQLTKKVYTKIVNGTNDNDTVIATLEIQQTIGNIYRFVHDFGWWMQSMNEHFKITSSAVDLAQLLIQLQGFFREQLAAKGNMLILPVQEKCSVITNGHLLKIVISNILDNANKYTIKGKITISITENGDIAELTVTDNGRGIPPERLRKIQDYLSSETATEETTGYGYRFIRDFCRMMNIQVAINTTITGGTTVALYGIVIKTM